MLELLEALDATLLSRAGCFFAGGTAVSLLLGEYRESVDADFRCASTEGYRELRAVVFEKGLDGLLRVPGSLKQLRELRADQYGVRTFVLVGEVPIKLEFVREARVALSGERVARLPVEVLSRTDLVAEKLLANVDRVMDRATHNRDALDLGMMLAAWPEVADAARERARSAYGAAVDAALLRAVERLSERAWLVQCLAALQMSEPDGLRALGALRAQ